MTVLSGTRWQGSGGGRREGDVRSSRPARVAARVKVGVLLVAVPRRPVLFWVPRKQSSRLRLPAAILVEREVPGDRRGEAAGSGAGQTLPVAGRIFHMSESLSAGAWRVFKLQIATHG